MNEYQTNHHHMFWQRRDMRTPVLRTLRNHPMAVHKMEVGTHSELHANLPPPPRQTPDLALGAISLLNELRDDGYHTPVNVHLALAEYYFDRRDKLATRIGVNIMRQTGYIAESEELLK